MTFFAELIHSSTAERTTTQKHNHLTACGESLTSDEAMEEVHCAEEEKENKEKKERELLRDRKERKKKLTRRKGE